MTNTDRIGLLAGVALLNLGVCSCLFAQTRSVYSDQSVPEMLASFRSGDLAVEHGQITKIEGSLTHHPERWSRAKLDSLSEGIVEVILETQAEERRHTASLLVLLTRDVDLPGRQHLGTFGQLVSIYEANLSLYTPDFILEQMGKFEEPRAVNYLAP